MDRDDALDQRQADPRLEDGGAEPDAWPLLVGTLYQAVKTASFAVTLTVTPSSSGSLREKLVIEKSPNGPSVPEASLAPVNTVCPVSGSPVNPKYRVVYDGKVIGFCCPECPKAFWADPEACLAKLR